LLPELAKQRDDVAVLERRAQRGARWQTLTEDIARLQGAVAAAETALADAETRHRAAEQQASQALSSLQRALAEADGGRRAAEHQVEEAQAVVRNRSSALDLAVARSYELDARVHQAESTLDAMRASWSWRLTAPLRAVGGGFRRTPRRES